MPRLRIIILDRPDPLNDRIYRYALWADVPAAQQRFYASSAATSVWLDATPADVDALRTGQVREKVETLQVDQGVGMAQVQVFLQDVWTRYQGEVTANIQWQRYSSTWDGTTWVVTNVVVH